MKEDGKKGRRELNRKKVQEEKTYEDDGQKIVSGIWIIQRTFMIEIRQTEPES
jgi:hypothetical protein